MSAQQRIKDIIQLLKKDRKAQTIAGCIVVAIVFLMVHEPKKNRNASPAFVVREQSQESIGASSAQEVYNDLQEVVISRLDQQKEILDEFQDELQNTNSRIEENEIRTAEIFETLIKRVESQRPALPDYHAANGEPMPSGDSPLFPDEDPFAADSLESFGEIADIGTVAPPLIQAVDDRSAYIAPTDFVRVKLLAGVNAPTDGTPYPVLLEVIGDVQSPDGGSLPLGGARMLAAAQGSLVDSRALFRLTTLTMRLPDGELIDLGVDGWIVGEDGIRGMKGVPIDPLGKVLAASAVAGFVGGFGEAIAGSQVQVNQNVNGGITQSITGDTTEFALGRAIGESSNIWTEMIRQRAQEAKPMIQVYSGREATAIFSRGTTIPRLFQLINGDEENDVFSGLD